MTKYQGSEQNMHQNGYIRNARSQVLITVQSPIDQRYQLQLAGKYKSNSKFTKQTSKLQL